MTENKNEISTMTEVMAEKRALTYHARMVEAIKDVLLSVDAQYDHGLSDKTIQTFRDFISLQKTYD